MTKNIVRRLTLQLSAKGVPNAKQTAISKLTQYGALKGGKLTEKGRVRQSLGAAGRAKDRASKASGRPATDYTYNARTNRATLKRK